MQALTQIGFTEKDFELASKLIEMATKSNKIFSGEASLEVEFGVTHPVARTLANELQRRLKAKKNEAIQENDELVGLQYKLIQLKRLIAQGNEPIGSVG